MRPITAITNHSVSGTSASAVTRCRHQCSIPSLAEPRPIARPRGERIGARVWGSAKSVAPVGHANHPDEDRQHRGGGEHCPAAEIDTLELKTAPSVPPQMPDAVAQMVEQRGAPAEQQHEPEPRAEEALHAGMGLWPV